jgi:outer membrane lipoprotein-sorting protein
MKNNKTIVTHAFILLSFITLCQAAACSKAPCSKPLSDSVSAVLNKLNQQAGELKSYQCQIEHLFTQPLLESQTLKKGVLYYKKTEAGSALRINFDTIKQDDEPQQKKLDQYIFDGVWLTHIDHHIKEVNRYQLAEANQPIDAFELAKRNFPIIGFNNVETLEKDFDIKLVKKPSDTEKTIQLQLKVKPDSTYKDDYTTIDFWVDKKQYLPAKIIATTTEEDLYEIKLLNAKLNKKIEDKIFELKIPKGFGKPKIVPLKKENQP